MIFPKSLVIAISLLGISLTPVWAAAREGDSDRPEMRRLRSSKEAPLAVGMPQATQTEHDVTSPKSGQKHKAEDHAAHDSQESLTFDPLLGVPVIDDGSQAALDPSSIKRTPPKLQSAKAVVFGTWPPSRKKGLASVSRSTSLNPEGGAQHFDAQMYPPGHPLVPECWVTEEEHRPIPNPLEAGWGFVGNLTMYLHDLGGNVIRTCVGSGTLVRVKDDASGEEREVVLTAAHNLYIRNLGTAFSDVVFQPARSGEGQPNSIPYSIKSTSMTVHPGYVAEGGEEYKKYDIGMVTLAEPVGHEVGWASYGYMPDDRFPAQRFDMVGYPSSVWQGGSSQSIVDRRMFYAAGPVTKITPDQVYYMINTSLGHSGSPLLDSDKCIRAVHAYGGTPALGNCATRISQAKEALIRDWIMEQGLSLNAPAFHTRYRAPHLEGEGSEGGERGEEQGVAAAAAPIPAETPAPEGRKLRNRAEKEKKFSVKVVQQAHSVQKKVSASHKKRHRRPKKH
jgi:V8-like Glu-specific endopeptidase